jgi:hypothetical protein
MYIRRLLYNQYSGILISMILGFGLATLFRKTCSIRGCYVFKGPSMDKIEGQTFKTDGKCYKYGYQHKSCNNTNSKIIGFSSTK